MGIGSREHAGNGALVIRRVWTTLSAGPVVRLRCGGPLDAPTTLATSRTNARSTASATFVALPVATLMDNVVQVRIWELGATATARPSQERSECDLERHHAEGDVLIGGETEPPIYGEVARSPDEGLKIRAASRPH